jgi:serine O-acetyltransferase
MNGVGGDSVTGADHVTQSATAVPSIPHGSAWTHFRHAVRADHDAMLRGDTKYGGKAGHASSWLLGDAFRRIGFQMLIAYRVMRLLRAWRLTPLAMAVSRMIRHVYAAEIHWDAELAPGVALVHGVGLVISRDARVGSGCILFQSVTLGVSIDPVTRISGGPTLGENVHVGPGAALLGPILIGSNTKIMANAVVFTSIPENSVVEVPSPTIRTRLRGEGAQS